MDNKYCKYSVREIIIRTLGTFDIEINNELIKEIEEIVRSSCNDHGSEKGFAHKVARNKAVDIVRRRASERRTAVIRAIKEEKARIAKTTYEQAKIEFWPTAKMVIKNITGSHKANVRVSEKNAQKQMEVLWLAVFEGISYEDLSKCFSINRNSLNKGKVLNFGPDYGIIVS